ncbi:MAG: hypothetical protein IGS48_18165, partial [Oscillatoriales cyanobacterium C42_A2020_001]|nr:hypothetical protein [Leptolyngbyaceae cyanobacterium C42_A2020_001]
MIFLEHLWGLLLLLVIVLGPVPISLWLSSINQDKKLQYSLADNLLVLLTVWCAIQIFIALTLGAIHQFFLIPVIGFELILFLSGAVILFFSQKLSPKFLFQKLFRSDLSFSRAEVLILSSIALTGVVLLIKLFTEVIIDYDSLWYHLPIMARWYQEGSFVRLDEFLNSGDWVSDAISYYPFNWEILCILFVMPFQEDALVALPNLVAYAILGLSIYLLSLSIGASRLYSMAGACLVLTIPLIIQHVNSLHVDLPFAAFFMVALYFVISFNRSRSSASHFCDEYKCLSLIFE